MSRNTVLSRTFHKMNGHIHTGVRYVPRYSYIYFAFLICMVVLLVVLYKNRLPAYLTGLQTYSTFLLAAWQIRYLT